MQRELQQDAGGEHEDGGVAAPKRPEEAREKEALNQSELPAEAREPPRVEPRLREDAAPSGSAWAEPTLQKRLSASLSTASRPETDAARRR